MMMRGKKAQTGAREANGELRVAEGCQERREAGDDEGDHNRRTGDVARHRGGEHVDARADHVADAEQNDVER